jgi:sugar phosphate isomerase/epimerase
MFRNLSTDALGITSRQNEAIELALSHGFKGMDFDAVDFFNSSSRHGPAMARRLLDSARLKIGAWRLPVVWDESDELYQREMNRLAAIAKTAAEIGATRAITTIAAGNDIRPYHDNFEFHRRRLAEIADMLGRFGVQLGLELVAVEREPHSRAFQFINTLDQLITLINMISQTNLGLVLDLFQVYAGGNTLDDLKKLAPERIVAVYLSDMPADLPREELTANHRLLPGETGAIDSAQALTFLAEVDYEGPVSPAADREPTQSLKREALVRLAAERLDAAWKAAGLDPQGKLEPATRP